jgi:hypothetical protein
MIGAGVVLSCIGGLGCLKVFLDLFASTVDNGMGEVGVMGHYKEFHDEIHAWLLVGILQPVGICLCIFGLKHKRDS